MAILLGIDGTGPLTDAEYGPSFRNSFVHYILTHTRHRRKLYRRGPSAEGLGTPYMVSEGFEWCELQYVARRAPILLTGYSRGAAACVAVAQRLQRQRIPVAAMALFDCVDRAVGLDATRVPSNVRVLVHATRDPQAGSRESFGHAGTDVSGATRHDAQSFYGTHGAIGGCHWTGGVATALIDEGFPDYGTNVSYAEDLACATRVWRWVFPRLQRHGFDVTVRRGR